MEFMQEHLIRIYYSNPRIIIIDNPYNGNSPTLVVRTGEPDWEEIKRILKLCNMNLVGESYIRKDGLFCHPVKEVIEDGEGVFDKV